MIEEEEYFRIIESHFLQKRGNPILLSPREWTLIREWYEAEIEPEIVLRAIDRAFEAKKEREDENPIVSLRYCRRFVKSEHKKFLKSLEGKPGAFSGRLQETGNVREFLEQLEQALKNSSATAASAGNRSLSDILLEKSHLIRDTILAYFEKNPGDFQRVEEKLAALEKEIEDVLLGTLSDEQIMKLKEASMRELKPFEGKLDFPVFQEMLRRSLIKAIRKLYNIPRLSLFYM